MKSLLTALTLLALLSPAAFAAERATITQVELVVRTQELMDAVVPGDQEPWKKYFADDALYFDEKGRKMDKTALVKDISPMPKGYSGEIKIANPESRMFGNTAVLSYDSDEVEYIFGQRLTARYHSTDTWMYRAGRWQIVASQVLRYYEDPAVGASDPKKLELFVGTYQLAPDVTMTVTKEGDNLFSERKGRPREQLFPETDELFFRKGVEGRRLFHVAADGKVDTLIDRRNNEDVVWKKIQ